MTATTRNQAFRAAAPAGIILALVGIACQLRFGFGAAPIAAGVAWMLLGVIAPGAVLQSTPIVRRFARRSLDAVIVGALAFVYFAIFAPFAFAWRLIRPKMDDHGWRAPSGDADT